ncbi:MAG: hypothetical protein R2941_21860 [Desulfobacterales bacterium]
MVSAENWYETEFWQDFRIISVFRPGLPLLPHFPSQFPHSPAPEKCLEIFKCLKLHRDQQQGQQVALGKPATSVAMGAGNGFAGNAHNHSQRVPDGGYGGKDLGRIRASNPQ